jgi:hypothetical protein
MAGYSIRCATSFGLAQAASFERRRPAPRRQAHVTAESRQRSPLRAVLGPLAWFEDQWQERDIWYASVLHFAAPLLDASGLVDWARSRQDVPAFDIVLDTLSLVRARYREDDAGRRMVMEPWHTAELTALPLRSRTARPSAQLAAVFSALDAACAGGVFSRRCWI